MRSLDTKYNVLDNGKCGPNSRAITEKYGLAILGFAGWIRWMTLRLGVASSISATPDPSSNTLGLPSNTTRLAARWSPLTFQFKQIDLISETH
jgi:hypothetical protein